MSSPPLTPAVVILVAEDDAGDRILIEESLRATKIRKQVRMVADGEEAMEYLHQRGRYQVSVVGLTSVVRGSTEHSVIPDRRSTLVHITGDRHRPGKS